MCVIIKSYLNTITYNNFIITNKMCSYNFDILNVIEYHDWLVRSSTFNYYRSLQSDLFTASLA